MKQRIIIALGISLLLMGCGGGKTIDSFAGNNADLTLALKETVNKTIIPTVEGFLQSSQQFKQKTTDFCGAPSKPKLTELQDGWKSLSLQWYKLAIYNFGPVNDDVIFPKINYIDSLRQRGTDYTGTIRTEITNDMNSAVSLNEAYFSGKDFNRVGLLALELLAFETADNAHLTDDQSIVDEFIATPRKCELLKGLSALNVSHARYIRDGWKTEHLSTGKSYKSLFLNNQFDNGDKSIPVLIVSIQSHLDYLSRRNVATIGAKTAGYGFENIQASINEIKLVLKGASGSQESFFGVMKTFGAQNSVDIVEDNIAAIEAKIQSRNVAELNASMGLLDGNFKREIPQGIGVVLGINFTDGD